MPRRKREVPLERYTVMTQAEVARHLGISAMRVSQIERAAFAKLAEEFEKRRIAFRRRDHASCK